jgi:hypothetical protein
LPPKIYLKLARVAHFNQEDQAEAREFDANMLGERCNTTLFNVRKYQAALKRYYNKSVVQRELNIRDLVLKRISVPNTSTRFQLPRRDRSS